MKELTASVGVQDFTIDWSGKGNPFFIDVRNSESAWDSINATGYFTSHNQLFHPCGIKFEYLQPTFDIEIFFSALLREGFNYSRDERIWVANLTYRLKEAGLPEDSRLNILAAVFAGGNPTGISNLFNQKDQNIQTLGVGMATPIPGVEGLDASFEAYFQFGDAGRAIVMGVEETLEANGYAYQLGVGYTFKKAAGTPSVGLSYFHVSGDDDASDAEIGTFISYEGNNDFIIIEHNVLGLDIDENYRGFKLNGSYTVSLPEDKKMTIIGKIGFFQAVEEIPIPPAVPPPGLERSDDLGTEIDVVAVLPYAKNVTLTAGIAYLSGADALELVTTDRENAVLGFLMGAEVNF
jgi:hypothetical protein